MLHIRTCLLYTSSIDPLAEEYGISRTPIIQAVKTMVAEGMLQMAPNGKILVPEFSRQEVIDILKRCV